MPDTGAPWNIPYVDSTDLVSDWPTDSLALANAIDAGLDTANNAGIGSNVVQTILTTPFTTSSATFTDITGLTVSITPTSATSKVLLIAQVAVNGTEGVNQGFHIKFAGGNTATYIGDASGSNRVRTVFGGATNITSYQYVSNSVTMVYLDSPATTSATTYSAQVRYGLGGTVYVNRTQDNSDFAFTPLMASSITAIEVAA